jgi:adenylate kinase family enzyme
MENIKDLFEKYGLDPNHVLGLEYKKAQFYIDELVLRTEKTLIDIQEKEGMEFYSERQKSVETTLRKLLFANSKMKQMELLIYRLELENELLLKRLKLRK